MSSLAALCDCAVFHQWHSEEFGNLVQTVGCHNQVVACHFVQRTGSHLALSLCVKLQISPLSLLVFLLDIWEKSNRKTKTLFCVPTQCVFKMNREYRLNSTHHLHCLIKGFPGLHKFMQEQHLHKPTNKQRITYCCLHHHLFSYT